MAMKNQFKGDFDRHKVALLERGLPVKLCQNLAQLSARVDKSGCKRRYKEGAAEHIARYLGEFQRVQRADGAATGPAISAFERPPYRPSRHPRLAEIEAFQPRLWTPTGVGNGAERQHGYGRGR
ncbi:MAG: hypothetical protein KER_03068 [Kerstersia gyiorum]|uniref:hypothetical protein n=1 Tax=Kerstersia gyiorum TaxID=206506 RepID=UPI0030CDBF31